MAEKPAKKRDKSPSPSGGGEGYEFPIVKFDERAFMRREIEGAWITFWTVGFAIPAGLVAWALGRFVGDWRLGWAPIFIGLALLGPLLKRMGYSEENTTPKAMFGNWFLFFFTGLALWILLENVL